MVTCVLCAQKNGLIETIHLSTHNIGFGWEIRKLIFNTPPPPPPHLSGGQQQYW